MHRLGNKFLPLYIMLICMTAFSNLIYASDNISDVKVYIIESENNNNGYKVKFESSEFETIESTLGVLSKGFSEDTKLVILVSYDVPIIALTTMRSIASKIGFEKKDIRTFTFDGEKRGMIELSFHKNFVPYSDDPDDLVDYFPSTN